MATNSKQSGSNKVEIIILAPYNNILKGLHLQNSIYAFLFTVAFSLSSSYLGSHSGKQYGWHFSAPSLQFSAYNELLILLESLLHTLISILVDYS